MTTATKMQARMDGDEYQARLFTSKIIGLLNRYIPNACHREASQDLYRMALEHGLEMTSKAMRYEYEAWKRTTLPGFQTIFVGENQGTVVTQGK